VDYFRRIQRELEGDATTEGVPDDMCPFHTQVRQQRTAISSVLRDSDQSWRVAAARITAPGVGDEPVPI
jgi:hypothetical protein